jgi:hypothetical protein
VLATETERVLASGLGYLLGSEAVVGWVDPAKARFQRDPEWAEWAMVSAIVLVASR